MTAIFNVNILEFLLILEITLLVMSVVINSSVNIYFSRKEKRYDESQKFLKSLIVALITEKERLRPNLVEKRFITVRDITPILEEFNNKIRGNLWEEIKNYFINDLLKDKLEEFAKSKKLVKRSWAIRAIKLIREHSYDEVILNLLQDPIPIIRFGAGICAIKSHREPLLQATIDQMAKERPFSRYPYLDEMIQGDDFIFSNLLKRYREDKECEVRKCCLQVLSTKAGYLTQDVISADLESESYELRWWAIRSLENNPTKEIAEYLISQIEDQNWKIEALVVRILGMIRAKFAKDQIAAKLQSENVWVRFSAAVALKDLGSEGIKVLKAQTEGWGKEAAEYVLSLHTSDLKTTLPSDPEHWLKTFY